MVASYNLHVLYLRTSSTVYHGHTMYALMDRGRFLTNCSPEGRGGWESWNGGGGFGVQYLFLFLHTARPPSALLAHIQLSSFLTSPFYSPLRDQSLDKEGKK